MGVMSVVTIPLKTEKWQSDLLMKRFEVCRQIYNSMLGYELKKLRAMERSEEYKQAQAVIANAYKTMDVAERKKDADFKAAIEVKKELMKQNRFSKQGFVGDTTSFYKHFNKSIPSAVAGCTIAPAMWAAFDDYFYGTGRQIKFKRKGDWRSMVSDGKSGIRILDDEDNTIRGQADGRNLYCVCGSDKARMIKMPLKIDRRDYYKLEMLDKPYKQVRIVNKEVRGKLKWYAQITVDAPPVAKYDSKGNEKHKIKKGKMGVYVDTSHVVYTTNGRKFEDINLENTDADIYYDTRIAELQRYMESSRRTLNPDNFNEDGTIKKGIYKDGERHRLRWTFSNGYRRANSELKDLYRVQAENRRLERIIIANEILSHGNDITINDFPFQWAAMRKKEDEKTETGANASKSKKGYDEGHNAPALLVTLIDTKLKSAGHEGVTKVKIENIEKDEGYRRKYAKQLLKK
jgi:hypothetical protein